MKKNNKKIKTTVKKTKKPVAKKVARKVVAIKKKTSKKVTAKKTVAKKTVAKKKPIKKLIKKLVTKKPAKKSKPKKTATKKVVKKTVNRKTSTKKTKKVFVTAPEERCFWINNGSVLRNLKDLHKAFKSMSKEQFVYHARGKNNDFALWVEYVLLDKKCASALKKAKTQKKSSQVVGDAVKKYK